MPRLEENGIAVDGLAQRPIAAGASRRRQFVFVNGRPVDAAEIQRAALRGYATATDLADYLVKKGLPFRDAHEIVAHAVKQAIASGVDLAELPLATLQGFHASITEDVFDVLTLQGSLNARNVLGGTAPAQVRQQIARHQARLA